MITHNLCNQWWWMLKVNNCMKCNHKWWCNQEWCQCNKFIILLNQLAPGLVFYDCFVFSLCFQRNFLRWKYTNVCVIVGFSYSFNNWLSTWPHSINIFYLVNNRYLESSFVFHADTLIAIYPLWIILKSAPLNWIQFPIIPSFLYHQTTSNTFSLKKIKNPFSLRSLVK